jgi:DUF4097 and DUF4098 domain-containing protein YvlB
MRRSIVFVPVLLLVTFGCVRPRVPLVLHETTSFPAPPDKLVLLDTGTVDTEVTVAGSTTITVETDLEVRASSAAAARKWLEDHKPEISDSPGRLSVHPATRRTGLYLAAFHQTRARVTVTMPATCRLEITTTSGDVRLSGSEPLPSPVLVTTTSGDLKVEGGVRALAVHTSSGDCRIDGPPLASLELDSTSGDLRLRSGAARLAVETSSGDITADDLTGALTFHSSSGDLRATWFGLPTGTKIDVETSSGDVTLLVPTSSMRGTVSTSSGSLHCELPCTRQEHSCTLTGPEDASQLRVTTTSGDVRVRGLERHDADKDPSQASGDQAPTKVPAEAR